MSEFPSSAERIEEHVVFFTTALGDPAAERYPSLQAAVSRVESLCNDDHVQDAKVYELVPVPLQIRSYYRVEVDSAARRPAAPPPSATAPEVPDAPVRREARDAIREALQGGVLSPPQDADDSEPSATHEDPRHDDQYEGQSDDAAQAHGRNLGFFVH